MLKYIKLILLSLLIFQASALAADTSELEHPKAWVEIRDILAAPSDYEGRTVTVRGWISIRHEDYGIWGSQSDYESRNMRNCISLLNIYRDDIKNRKLDQSDVLVTGVFTSDIFHEGEKVIVRLGACNESGIRFIGPNGLRKFIRLSNSK